LGKNLQIPELLAYFEQDGKLYLVQEYIEGQNLADCLQKDGKWEEIEIWQLLTEMLTVLQFVHSNNVIHRDIKPENIIRRPIPGGYQYVLVDFGAARYMTGTAWLKTGTIIGDPRYMADEQIQEKAIFASDLYSLGLTCLHLLTNIDPWSLFDSSEGKWVWQDYLTTEISDELRTVLEKLVQKPTKQRFHSVEEVLEALNHEKRLSKNIINVTPDFSQISSNISSKFHLKSSKTEIQSSSVISQKYSTLNLFPIQIGKKWGFTDDKGKMIIKPQFDSTSNFSEDLAAVQNKGKVGFINKIGEIVIPLKFDGAYDFSEGLAVVSIKDKCGFIDKTGKVVISLQFDGACNFSEGLAGVRIKGKCGFIDKTGRMVIPIQFDDVCVFTEELAVVTIQKKLGYINKEGEIVIPTQFDNVYHFTEGLAAVKIKEKWGYINKKGKIVISPRFDKAYSYGEFDLAVVRIDSKYGYIDKTGKIIIPAKFDGAFCFSDGLAIVKINSIFGNNLGYINRTAKMIIKPQFEYAEYFKNSRARVKKNNFIFTEEGLIDKTGKWIIKTKKINRNSLAYLTIIVMYCLMFLIKVIEVNPIFEFLMLCFILIIFIILIFSSRH
jgi:hypothetical protein